MTWPGLLTAVHGRDKGQELKHLDVLRLKATCGVSGVAHGRVPPQPS